MTRASSKRLEPVRLFLQRLRDGVTDAIPSDEDFGLLLSQTGQGSLILSRQEAAEYNDALAQVLKVYAADDTLSGATAKRAFNDAIFTSLTKTVGPTPQTNPIDAALIQLHADLSRPMISYECFIPIGGLSQDGLPFVFGQCRFGVFNDSQLRKFRLETRKHRVGASELLARLKRVRRLKESDLWRNTCGVVTVRAKDAAAARHFAQSRIRQTIDALNFFADIVPYHHGRLYVPGERHRQNVDTPVMNELGSWSVDRSIAGPVGLYEVNKIRHASNIRRPLRRVSAILKSEQRTAVDQRLLASVQWAGRATAEPRDDQAFLYYAIALESILLPSSDRAELGYRLRLRAAHLLGKGVPRRRQLMKTISKLYGIRSGIVHGGQAELDRPDLGAIRRICKTVIVTLVSNRRVQSRSCNTASCAARMSE